MVPAMSVETGCIYIIREKETKLFLYTRLKKIPFKNTFYGLFYKLH